MASQLSPRSPDPVNLLEVTSVVGRFLEHSRIYYFQNGGDEEIYAGSADLMPRNIDHRVEVLFPLEDEKLIRRIRDELLAVYLADNTKARKMLPAGAYARKKPGDGKKQVNAQEWLLMKRRQPAHESGKRIRARRTP